MSLLVLTITVLPVNLGNCCSFSSHLFPFFSDFITSVSVQQFLEKLLEKKLLTHVSRVRSQILNWS